MSSFCGRPRFGFTLLVVCDYVWVCVCVITCKTSILMAFMRTHTYTDTPGPSHTGAGTSVWCVY